MTKIDEGESLAEIAYAVESTADRNLKKFKGKEILVLSVKTHT